MVRGPSLTLGQSLQQRPELQLVIKAIQAQQSRFLELSDDATEAWLAQQVKDNPALRWRGRAIGGDELGRGYVAPADPDGRPQDWSWTASSDLVTELEKQLGEQRMNEREARAAWHIIHNLDHRGLLASSLEEIAEAADVDVEDVEDGQAVVMELEPEGCGASDLQDYLAWIVRRRHREDKRFPRLVAGYLDEFRDKNYKRIAKLERLELEDVETYAKMLSEVPPYPARGFAENPMAHVTPTIRLERDPITRVMKVFIDEPPRSRVMLNPQFEQKVKDLPPGKERQEAEDQLKAARAVVDQVTRRQNLLQRITEYAVKEQRAYFDQGADALRNLTMDAAARLLSESRPNISRAVKGRYYLYEGRVEPLRDLFTHRSKPGRVSKARLHSLLRQIVDEEDKGQPLSDAAIADRLRKLGVREARRTIAKHRELAGIPPVHLRRKTSD